jgi:molybdopterin molybdotransferase
MSKVGAGVVSFEEALEIVMLHSSGLPALPAEALPLLSCGNRVLAEAVLADRDQPPFDRSTRDGFAVRAAEFDSSPLRVAGQVRAGEQWLGVALQHGAAIEIMTGAPMPEGADAVVMVEHVVQWNGMIRAAAGRTIRSGENFVPRGSEARAGQSLLPAGTVMEGAEIALAASCGQSQLTVHRKPRVAIVATGDELVEIEATPALHQIRNSNSYGLAALVEQAGGEAVRFPIAPDRRSYLEETILTARRNDLMLLSGGVSMGKYDLVEEVLESLGAEFFFTGVRMQPGKPVVFGRLPAADDFAAQYFFGLPGNPVSTQVTFHCFVEPLLRAMRGAPAGGPRFAQATLAEDAVSKPGLMQVLPARMTAVDMRPQVRLVPWQGSGDLTANARANCYAVLPPEKERFAAGDEITVLLR